MLSGIAASILGKNATEGYFHPQRDGSRQQHSQAFSGAGGLTEDTVDLSPSVPQPLTPKMMQQAEKISGLLNSGNGVSRGQGEVLRQDRVQTALVALELLDADPSVGKKFWPATIPQPSAEEMEEAYRRLSQRLVADTGDDVKSLTYQKHHQRRLELLDTYRMADFDGLSAQLANSGDE